MFDKLILMCDGHIVYQGEPQNVPAHFAGCGIDFPKFKNPADIAMEKLAVSYPKKAADEELVTKLIKHYNAQ